MTLEEIMTRNAQVIEPDATLQEAARQMKNLDVGGLPVCDGEKIRGFVTDRDIAIRAVAEGEDPTTCKVSDVMSKEIHWCYVDEDVDKAAQLMEQHKIRRLLVLDRDKMLCGIVSLGDLAVEGEDDEFAGEVLEKVSEPAPAEA
ncbi:MAG TPA: CBS domain-containing protein [Vulgatibacter sp.]